MKQETSLKKYYQILDLNEQASLEEVQRAFEAAKKTYSLENKSLLQVFSPLEIAEMIKLSKEAFEVIKEARKKEIFPPLIAPPINPEVDAQLSQVDEWRGENLRLARELRGYSIEKVHDITKINTFYISALEEMKVQDLPALVYVRGYVVQIARALGLNTTKVATSYMNNFRNSLAKTT